MIDRLIYHACGTAVMYLLIHSLFYGSILNYDRPHGSCFAANDSRECPTPATDHSGNAS